MRQLVALNAEASWVLACRECVTAGFVALWYVAKSLRRLPGFAGMRNLPKASLGIVGLLIVVSLLIEVIGNMAMQWAMGIVGLAVTVPVIFGTVIVVGTLLGWFWLNETVSYRAGYSMGLLLAALVMLGLGVAYNSDAVSMPVPTDYDTLLLILGIVACVIAGTVFAMLNTSVRYAVTRGMPVAMVAFLVPFTGAVSLCALSICRFGLTSVFSTSREQYLLIFIGGLCNLLGFVSFIKGLQRTTVAHANAINASQVALAAIAGMTLFGEPPNGWLLTGVVLTILGIMAFDKPVEGAGP